MAWISSASNGSPLKTRTWPNSWIRLGCERAPEGKELLQMLLDGEIDAAIFGSENPEGGVKPLIPDADGSRKTLGGEPRRNADQPHDGRQRVDHPVSPRCGPRSLPTAQGERKANPAAGTGGALRFGVEAVRKSLETIIHYSERQGLIPRRFEVDELFNDVTRSLD